MTFRTTSGYQPPNVREGIDTQGPAEQPWYKEAWANLRGDYTDQQGNVVQGKWENLQNLFAMLAGAYAQPTAQQGLAFAAKGAQDYATAAQFGRHLQKMMAGMKPTPEGEPGPDKVTTTQTADGDKITMDIPSDVDWTYGGGQRPQAPGPGPAPAAPTTPSQSSFFAPSTQGVANMMAGGQQYPMSVPPNVLYQHMAEGDAGAIQAAMNAPQPMASPQPLGGGGEVMMQQPAMEQGGLTPVQQRLMQQRGQQLFGGAAPPVTAPQPTRVPPPDRSSRPVTPSGGSPITYYMRDPMLAPTYLE